MLVVGACEVPGNGPATEGEAADVLLEGEEGGVSSYSIDTLAFFFLVDT